MATTRGQNGTVDPTLNVRDLSEASNRRQDDLRDAERRYNDLRETHLKEIASLRSAYEEKLSAKESSRLDSIRQVDREDVAKTVASSNLAIGTLAKQTIDLATTLQNQVATTASAAEARRTTDMSEVNKRVSALELTSSASAGKQQVADPLVEKLMQRMDSLLETRAGSTGKVAGLSMSGTILMAAAALVVALLTIGGFIYALNRPAVAPVPPPQVVYVPAAQPAQTATISTSTPAKP